MLLGGAGALVTRLYSQYRPAPPNYPLLYPKYPLLRTIRALLKGTWGVLGFRGLQLLMSASVFCYSGPDTARASTQATALQHSSTAYTPKAPHLNSKAACKAKKPPQKNCAETDVQTNWPAQIPEGKGCRVFFGDLLPEPSTSDPNLTPEAYDPKAQNSPKALYSMAFGHKSVKVQ